jgi:hypothetical protein
MKWILTQREVLINVEAIGTVHVLKRRTKEKPQYAVVADLNYFDDERDYIYLTNEFCIEENADDVFKQVISWLVNDKSSNLLEMDRVVNEW